MSGIIHYLKNTSLTFRIISGLVLGVLTGLFFGEEAAGLHYLADAWIGLMQMTVLPYVTVSLIVGLGQLDLALARQLAVRGGLLMLLFCFMMLERMNLEKAIILGVKMQQGSSLKN